MRIQKPERENPRVPTPWFRRVVPAALFAGILVLAAVLRFQHLETREPRISDEADYLMEAQWISSLGHALLDSYGLYREERRSGTDLWKKEEQLAKIRDSIRGHAPYMARPGHVLLIALAMEFLEDPALAGAWVSAVFGFLTVPVLFALSRRLYGTGVALLASLFLSLSVCHVWYSRTGFAEADTTFFVVLTVYLYLLSVRRPSLPLFALTGLTAGLGFLVHHRFLLFLASIWLFEALRLIGQKQQGRKRRGIAPLLALNLFFALPLLALESVYHLAFIALQVLSKPLPCPTYFSQLLLILGYIQVNNLIPYAHFFTWHNFLTYPYLLWLFEGPLLCSLLAAGVFTLAARHRWSEGVIALLFLGPLLFYSFQNAEARFLSGSLPFGMICAALFLHSALDWARNRGPLAWRAAWFATLLVLATQSGIAWSRIQAHDRLRADYRATAQYLLATGNPSHISVYPHPFRLYLGEDRTAIPPSSEEELRELYEKGFRFVVLVEFMEYYVDRFDVPELTSRIPAIRSLPESRTLLEKIRKALKPEYEAACDFCVSPLNIFEINLNYKKSLAFIEESSQNRYGTIKVYDLGKYFPSENPGGESGSWEGEFPGKRTTVKASF